mgnify:CR=1 FL=1
MARFVFRLESVLNVRKHEEERCKLAFAAAMQRRNAADERLQDVTRRFEAALDTATQLSRGLSTVVDLMRSYDYRVALLQEQARAESDLISAERMLEAARVAMITARKERRAVELLKEKHHRKWKAEEDYREQIELDEAGLNAFLRRPAADMAEASA